MTTEILTVTQDDMTLDLLLWRRFAAEVRFRVESTYAAGANQDIAELGPILPVGTKVEVTLPVITAGVRTVNVVRLWN